MNTGHVLASLAVLSACATSPPTDDTDDGPPYTVEVGPEEVSLAIADGRAIPMPEFVKLAQRVTGRPITYRAADLAGASVQFVGTMRIPNESFFTFFQSMLYVNGFACETHGQGDAEVVEIVRAPADATRPR